MRVWDLGLGIMTDCMPDHEYLVKKVIHGGSALYSASRNVRPRLPLRMSVACLTTAACAGGGGGGGPGVQYDVTCSVYAMQHA